MLRTWLRAWPNHSGYNATRSHSAPRYLTPGWASSCRGAPDAVVISSTGGNLQRHSCQTQSPKQELLIALASVICLIPAVSILRKQVSPASQNPTSPPTKTEMVSPNTGEGFRDWQPENKTRVMSPWWIHRTHTRKVSNNH